jgi:kinesin family protein 5
VASSSGPEKDGFTFDRIFPPGAKQQEVFDYGVKEWVVIYFLLPTACLFVHGSIVKGTDYRDN